MSSEINKRYIWLNDKLVRACDAKVNILSPMAQFGLNVFEGIPCYWNREKKKLLAFRLEDHYRRLKLSSDLMNLECLYSKEKMNEAFVEAIQANNYQEDLSVRQTLFVDGFGSWGSCGPVGMFVSPIPRRLTSAEYNKKGLRCCISSWLRIDDNSLSPHIKCGANYMNSRAAQLEAVRNGYDTAIILNKYGKVTEGPGSCVFMIKNDELITPCLTDGILDSITRDTVIKIADDLKINVRERTIDRTELYMCQEAFLCGSSMGITPIVSIDGHELSKGSRETIMNRIMDTYRQIVIGENEKYEKYLTVIN